MKPAKVETTPRLTIEEAIKRSVSTVKQNNDIEPNPLIECEKLLVKNPTPDDVMRLRIKKSMESENIKVGFFRKIKQMLSRLKNKII